MNKHEINYPVYEKEALAVVAGIKHFHHYIYGRQFTVLCDNTAVTWLYDQKQPKGRIARWIMYLLQYKFEIKYRKGLDNGNADGISRVPVAMVEQDFMARLKKEQENDPELQRF